MFTLSRGSLITVLLVYVDDILISGGDTQMTSLVMKYLSLRFHMNNLGSLKKILGIEVARSKYGILLDQRKYALEILHNTGLLANKPVATPLDYNHSLSADIGTLLPDPSSY